MRSASHIWMVNAALLAAAVFCFVSATSALQPQPFSPGIQSMPSAEQEMVSQKPGSPFATLMSLTQTLARPVFSPKRLAAPNQVGQATQETRLKDINLHGILMDADDRVALIWFEKEAAMESLSVGQKVGDWSVTDIAPRSVRLERGDEVATLELSLETAASAQQQRSAASKRSARKPGQRVDAAQFLFEN